MARLFAIFVLAYLSAITAAQRVTPYPAYFHSNPEHRGDLVPLKSIQGVPLDEYEYQIIPSDEYPVIEYDSSADWSILDYILNPITAVTTVASKALSVGKWLIINGSLVVLGMALVLGFCAFTPYCTLTIEKPFAREIRSLNIPYLDDVEYYLNKAYNKYQAMQNVK